MRVFSFKVYDFTNSSAKTISVVDETQRSAQAFVSELELHRIDEKQITFVQATPCAETALRHEFIVEI